MSRIKWIILFFLPLMFSCSSNEEEAVIKGKISGFNNEKIVLSEIGLREITPLDSVKTDNNGDFKFIFEPESEGLYLLHFSQDEQIVLIIAPGEKVHIEGQLGKTDSFQITGSEESQAYLNYQQHTEQNRELIDSLTTLIRYNRSSMYAGNFDQEKALIDSVFEQQKEMAQDYIHEHPASLSSLIVLNQPFGRTLLFDEEDDLSLFVQVDSALMQRIPANKHSRDHHLRTEGMLQQREEKELAKERMQTGKVIPDISLPDSSNRKISLHSLKGNKVIVYFWSAFSGKSRQINSKLKDFLKSRNHNIEIYAVSLDQNPDIWKAAIKLDKPDWINVNESDGFFSPLVKLYGLPSNLPYFIILDEESRILYKGNDYPKAVHLLN